MFFVSIRVIRGHFFIFATNLHELTLIISLYFCIDSFDSRLQFLPGELAKSAVQEKYSNLNDPTHHSQLTTHQKHTIQRNQYPHHNHRAGNKCR